MLLIKIIDRLHNIQTIGSMSDKKIEKTVTETLTSFLTSSIYLGLLTVEQQFLDNCMHHTSKQQNKSYETESIFSFNNNNSLLLSLIS